MNGIILCRSKYGASAKYAHWLSEETGFKVIDTKKADIKDVEKYDTIILGGGVMHQMQLFPLIRKAFKERMNGYINTKTLENLDEYIVPASLNDDQGIMGAIKLAIDARD